MAEMTPVMMTYRKMMGGLTEESKQKMMEDEKDGKVTAMMKDNFKNADLDKDGLLNEAEYTGFFEIQKKGQ